MARTDREEYRKNYQRSRSSTRRSSSSSKGKNVFAILLILAALVVGGFWIYTLLPAELDLQPYTKVQYQGYDSEGTATVTFDYDQFAVDTAHALNEKRFPIGSSSKTYDADTLYQTCPQLKQAFTASVTPNQNLSNQTQVQIQYKINDALAKQYHLKLTGKAWNDTVKGLSETQTFDVFDQVEIVFVGPNHKAVASCLNSFSESPGKDLQLDFTTKRTKLSVGDTVSLVVSTNDEGNPILKSGEADFHYQVQTPSLQKKLKQSTSYLATMSRVPEDQLQAVKQKSLQQLQKHYDNSDQATYENWRYEGICFLRQKKNHHNRMFIVYSVTVTPSDDKQKTFTLYTYVQYRNMAVSDKGTLFHIKDDHTASLADKPRFPNHQDKKAGRTWQGYIETKGMRQLMQTWIVKNAKSYNSEYSQTLQQYT